MITQYQFMRYFLFLTCLLLATVLEAQKDYQTTQDISAKIKKKYREAFSSYNAFKYEEAIKQLDKIEKKAPRFVNAYLLEADCYLLLKEWEKAKACFEQALEIAPDYKPISHYRLGQLAMQSATYVEAGQQLSLFLEKARPMINFGPQQNAYWPMHVFGLKLWLIRFPSSLKIWAPISIALKENTFLALRPMKKRLSLMY